MAKDSKQKEKEKEKDTQKETRNEESIDPQKMLNKSYIIDDKMGKDELKKRLKNLALYLSTLEQDGTDKKNLTSISKALVNEKLMQHGDKVVRLLVACNLSDIIRINAPVAPFTEQVLKEVFKLFIQQFTLLEKPDLSKTDPTTFEKVSFLLHRLAMVKASIPLVDLNDDDLVLEYFRVFYIIVSPEHPHSIFTDILELSVCCLEELSLINSGLLDLIFEKLLPPICNEEPQCAKLSSVLLSRTVDHLQTHVTQYLNEMLDHNSESELSERVHDLLFEINKSSPSLLIFVLPHLQNELLVDNDLGRNTVVQLLSKIFCSMGYNVNYAQLFSAFLNRFNDKNEGIRKEMLIFAKQYCATHSEKITDINNFVLTRMRDFDEEIRSLSIDAVFESAKRHPELIDPKAISEMGERMRDKRAVVRKEAMSKLASLYKNVVTRHGLPDSWNETLTKNFGWIPSKIMQCYNLGAQEEDSLRVEKVLDEEILPTLSPTASNIEERTTALLGVLSTFDDKAKEMFGKLLKEKRSFQEEFTNFLSVRSGRIHDSQSLSQEIDEDEESESELDKKVLILAQKFPYPSVDKSRDSLNKLHDLKDSKIFKALDVIANPNSTMQLQKSARQDILTKIGKKSPLLNYVILLISHLRMTILCKESVPILFSILKETMANEKGKKKRTSINLLSLTLLTQISEVFPTFFEGCFPELSLLLNENDEIKTNTLIILSHVGSLLDGNTSIASTLKKTLTQIASEGNVLQSKYAVKTIHKIWTGKKGDTIFISLLRNLVTQLTNDRDFDTPLTSLTQIAKLSPHIFESESDTIVSFVMDEVLEKPKTRKSKKHKKKDDDDIDDDVKILGLKFLKAYLIGKQSEDEDEIKNILSVLLEFFDESGELSLAASKCVLSLLRNNKLYERLITPQQFHMLGKILTSSSTQQKEVFIKSLFKGLKLVQFHVKYVSLLGLCAIDNRITPLAKLLLTTSIKIRREFIKNNEEISNNPKVSADILPEYSVPYLIHTLAHSDFFTSDSPSYTQTTKCLTFFFDQILHEEDSFSFLVQMLEGLKFTEDAVDPSFQGVHIVAELSLLVVREKSEKRNWREQKHPGSLFLPSSMYKTLQLEDLISSENVTEKKSGKAKEKSALEPANKSYLPPNFQIHKTTTNNTIITSTPNQKTKTKPVSEKKSATKDGAKSKTEQPIKKFKAKKKLDYGSESENDEDSKTNTATHQAQHLHSTHHRAAHNRITNYFSKIEEEIERSEEELNEKENQKENEKNIENESESEMENIDQESDNEKTKKTEKKTASKKTPSKKTTPIKKITPPKNKTDTTRKGKTEAKQKELEKDQKGKGKRSQPLDKEEVNKTTTKKLRSSK